MSLKVWLPLNGNLNNLGSSNLEFSIPSPVNTSVNAGGKIGSCYGNNSNTAGGIISDKKINLGQTLSMFCWVKMNSFYSSSSLTGILGQHRYPSCQGMGITMLYLSSTTGKLSINTGNGSSTRTYNTYTGNTVINAGTWYHVGFTYDHKVVKLYVNGILDGTYTLPYENANINDYVQAFCWSFSSSTGSSLHDNYTLDGYLNDVRIYDHVLSQKEVSEIAKGLVLHYKLDDISSTGGNLVTGLAAGGQTTISNNTTVNISGTNSDTYFYINLSNAMVTGKSYKISCVGHFDNGVMYSFPIAAQNNTGPGRLIVQNGYCEMIFVANDVCQNAGTQVILDDAGRQPGAGTITNIKLEEVNIISDCSGYEYDGLINGIINISDNSARYNKCGLFSNSYIYNEIPFPYIDNNCQVCTLSAWVNIKAYTQERSCIIIGGVYLTITSAGKLSGYGYGKSPAGYHTGNTTIPLNTWTHVAIVWTETHIIGYINGIEDFRVACTGTLTSGNQKYIGKEGITGRAFNGYMSDIRIYTTALSDSDILDLYHTSAFIDNHSNLECYELVEDTTVPEIKKTGVVSTETFIERVADYLYLPAGAYVDTGLNIPVSTSTQAEVIIRYASGGSGRDLMGYSGTRPNGYFGVSNNSVWENLTSYTSSDITQLNKIVHSSSGASDTSGSYKIGMLGTGYSVRNKYIYHVKLWKAGVLERDLYPASMDGQVGLIDILHCTFYPAQGTSGATLGDDATNDKARFFADHIESREFIEI